MDDLLGSLQGQGRLIVGFKDFKTTQFLIYKLQRLELPCFRHLLLEPCLCFVLFDLLEVGMIIIDVSILCQGLREVETWCSPR